MLRMEFHTNDQFVTWRIEGRFVGSFAEHAQSLVSRCSAPQQIVFDLSEVTFVDDTGEEVLKRLKRSGLQFVARNRYATECMSASRHPSSIGQSRKPTLMKMN